MYDILIKNGLLLDGTGAPGVQMQIAIKDGKIAKISREITGEAAMVIDAAGQVVTPGFIDSHSHSDQQFFAVPGQTEKVEQGITTSVAGQCGYSICGRDAPGFWEDGKNHPLGANMAVLIGHGTIRFMVMGTENREPTAQELEAMKGHLRSAMEQGAMGVSFGLTYVPGCYAKTPELIEMAKVVADYDGIVAAHIRNEGVNLVNATAEFIEVVRQSGARGVLSHHKVCGHGCWGAVNTTLAMVDKAVEEGLELYLDVYPYVASHTKFSNCLIPSPWRADGVDALLQKIRQPENIQQMRDAYYKRYENTEWIQLTYCPGKPEYVGLRMSEIAALRGQDEFDAMLDIVELTKDDAKACFFSICEEDVQKVMAHPRAMICTDSGVRSATMATYHPRLRGSFPRALGRYVRERKVVDLPEMIRKMTSLPAAVYRFLNKGLLKEGFDADICIFDPDRILDQAEFADPSGHAIGLSYTIVGGKIAAKDAFATGELGGKLLYRK